MGARRLATAVARWNTRRDTIDIQELRRRTELLGARFIIPCDAEWPQQLADLGPGAPSGLWVRGDATVVAKSGYGAAIVGARAATAYGETVTAMLVSRMAERGLTVVSGGAFGIDACAHQCALRMQTPTIAVLAGGIDQLYPAANSDLLRAIESSGGALVSESAPGSTPMKSRFLSRNRLIAALSGATVVVEAAWRSGSLSTANHALELGRPVGVVPGPITSAQSAGCHRLLRESPAEVLSTPEDVVDLVPGQPKVQVQAGSGSRSDAEQFDPMELRVLDGLKRSTPVSVDDLCVASGLAPAEVLMTLSRLEFRGAIRQDLRGWHRSR
jgi:DNA processing protein